MRSSATQAGLYTAVAATNGLALKASALAGVPASTAAILRGLSCIAILAVIAKTSRLSLRPTNLRLQVIRGLFAGVSLCSLIASYQYLSATTIAVLSRLDLPILALITSTAFQNRKTRIVMAATSIGLLVASWLILRPQSEDIVGIALLGIATASVVCGYLFLRHSAKTENIAIVAGVPAVACILFGAIGQVTSTSELSLSIYSAAMVLASGVCMYLMYEISSRRHQTLSSGAAEYPIVLAALAVLILEPFVLGTPHTPLFVGMMAVGAVAIGLTIYLSGEPIREATAARN